MATKTLLNSPEINIIESNFISLFDRTFKKGVKNTSGPKLKNSVNKWFTSFTFEKQLDGLIDDLYLYTVDESDKLIKKALKASLQRSSRKNFLRASEENIPDEPLALTEEAVKEASGLAEEITESIIRVLKDEAIYQEGPDILARRVLDLWGGEKYRAVRWARTFSADVATNTSYYRYKESGIEEYQIYATIDEKTSMQCRLMHGTVFRVDSPEAKLYRCPFHHHCRTTILPIANNTEIPDSLRYENRDFSQQVGQNLNPIEEGLDKELVKNTFKNIDTFKEKWSIPQYILDEDVEKRLIKLGVGIST